MFDDDQIRQITDRFLRTMSGAGFPIPAPEQVPPGLRHILGLPIFIGWAWGEEGRKRPVDHNGSMTGYDAPGTWSDYATWYRSIALKWPTIPYAGTGISFRAVMAAKADILAIDIDDCIDPTTGRLLDVATWVVEACQSYTEVSPSGKGIRIVGGAGGWPGGERKRVWQIAGTGGEVYRGESWVTLTFRPLPGYEGMWRDEIGEIAGSLDRAPTAPLDTGRNVGRDGGGSPLAPVEVVAETLGFIPNGAANRNWDRWSLIGMIVWRATEGSGDGLAAWEKWSEQNPCHGIKDTCENRWNDFFARPPTRIGYGTLHRMAREAEAAAGRQWRGGALFKERQAEARKAAKAEIARKMGPVPVSAGVGTGVRTGDATNGRVEEGSGEGGEDDLPWWSDEMLARRMVDTWGADLRYVAAWGKWLRWRGYPEGGGAWKDDATLEAMAMARATCSASAAGRPAGLATKLLEARTIRATEGLARADRRVAGTTEQWDTDPWLLNTPGGVLDLRTGAQGGAVMRTGDRAAHMTKTTSVAPDFAGDCPMWTKFLADVTGNDTSLMSYLGRIAGYCLTGDVSEHALFFLFGTGGNGKGTFMNTLSWILGVDEYARHAGAETFTVQKGEQHLTEIARLRGARMVVTPEVEEGKAWAEARINMLTGGDPVSARFMNQDHFTFKPQFKLLISGNHKPRIRSVNEAVKRRMNLVPFEVTIPVKDLELGEKLKGEAGTILAWAVRGCWEWQRYGLSAPEAVKKATGEYLSGEDTRTAWLRAQCRDLRRHEKRDDWKVRTRPDTLFLSWRNWATTMGEFIGNQRSFLEWLNQQGFETEKNSLNQTVVKDLHVLTMSPVTNENRSDDKGFGVIDGGKTGPTEKK